MKRRHYPRLIAGIAVAMASAACSNDESPPPQASDADKFVVRSVRALAADDTNAAIGRGLAAPTAVWSLESDLRIGGIDANPPLSSVDYVLPSRGGAVMVLDSDFKEIFRFDESGRFVDRLGGAGAGPGEFTAPSSLGWWRGMDTIWVQDGVLKRVTLFDQRGRLVRTMPIDQIRYQGQRRISDISHVLPDGSWIGAAVHVTLGEGLDRVPLVHVRDGKAVDRLAQMYRPGGVVRIQSPEGGIFRHPLPDGSLVVFEPNGDRIAVIDRRVGSQGDNHSVMIRLLSGDGTFHWAREIHYTPTMIPAAFRDSVNAQIATTFSRMFRRSGLSKRQIDDIKAQSVELPSHFPPISNAMFGLDGNIWLEWAVPQDGVSFVVLDGSGATVGLVRSPEEADAEVRAVAREHVWGVIRDTLDVPYVIRWRIVK